MAGASDVRRASPSAVWSGAASRLGAALALSGLLWLLILGWALA